MISDLTYLNWQKKLSENYFFRGFWLFWGAQISGVFAVVAIVLLFLPTGERAVLNSLAAFVFSRFILDEIIYVIYKKRRPYQRLNFKPIFSKVFVSWDTKRPDAFPSAHATSIFALSLVMYKFFPLLGLAGFIIAILNGIARVILGYHEPIDVVSGWVVGLIGGALILHFLVF